MTRVTAEAVRESKKSRDGNFKLRWVLRVSDFSSVWPSGRRIEAL